VVLLEWRTGQIAVIHDYRFAPYVVEALTIEELD